MFEPFNLGVMSFYYHKYDSEWYFSIFDVTSNFEYNDSRSLFCLGKRGCIWRLELFWIRIAYD